MKEEEGNDEEGDDDDEKEEGGREGRERGTGTETRREAARRYELGGVAKRRM